MKKNRPAILFFIIALTALLIVIYAVAAPKMRQPDAVTEETTVMLADFKPADITALAYTKENLTLSFVYDNIWYLEDDRGFPLDQEKVSGMSGAISSIPMSRSFAAGEISESDSGLANPAYTIVVSYAGGTNITYHIGNYNSFNNNYYFSIEGDDSVYMIASGLSVYFDYTLLELAVFDTLPTLTVDAISSYDVVNPVTSFNVTDSDMLEKLTALYFDDCVAYKPDAQTLESFGLSDSAPAMTVHYTLVQVIATEDGSITSTAGIPVDYDMTFRVGSRVENDDTLRYVMYNDSPLIYTMDAATLETLLKI
ncbi:MAG: DUF4340 domain-containing protein [Eubacteriales bacterium]|nr:DUF4340 domain-containing protein [Eubacteriales bacterium]